MKDFAKLFVREGIGQVLVTREESPDTDLPSVVVRLPDFNDLECRVSLGLDTATYDRAEKFADDMFAGINEDNLDIIIGDYIDMRNRMIEDMNQGETGDDEG